MDRQDLMRRTLASMAAIGDIYTDAKECSASVAAAQNLNRLASMLSADTETIAKGILRASADGVCDEWEADVRADGSLLVDVPSDYDTSGKTWTLATSDGGEFLVGLFTGETTDEDRWIVEDAESFYQAVLRNPDPLAAPSAGPRP